MREATLLAQQVRVAWVVTLVLLGLVAIADYAATRQIQAGEVATRRAQRQLCGRRCRLGQRLQIEQRKSGLQAVQP